MKRTRENSGEEQQDEKGRKNLISRRGLSQSFERSPQETWDVMITRSTAKCKQFCQTMWNKDTK